MSKILFYTTHKAGSSFLDRLLSQTARRFEIGHYSENQERNFDTIHEQSWSRFIEQMPNGCFGPIRGGSQCDIFPDQLGDYSIVLHLRDPRDVLTSMYYSFAYSHTVRPDRFHISQQKREQWRADGIDEFVVEFAPGLQRVYQRLCRSLLGRGNVTLIRYEDMVLNYGGWLSQFLSAFGDVKIKAKKTRHWLLPQFARQLKLRRQLYLRHKDSFQVESENILNHKRRVVPGDHREKLRPATISWLDEQFSDFFSLQKPAQLSTDSQCG